MGKWVTTKIPKKLANDIDEKIKGTGKSRSQAVQDFIKEGMKKTDEIKQLNEIIEGLCQLKSLFIGESFPLIKHIDSAIGSLYTVKNLFKEKKEIKEKILENIIDQGESK